MDIHWRHPSVIKLIKEQGSSASDNPDEIIKNLSRDLVLKAFTREWQGPPYDIIYLAKMLGFEVMPNDTIPDARISPKTKGKYLIEYNPFQYQSRINFSIAHEIGHTLFSDCADTIRYRNKEDGVEKYSWELEFLCNISAAEILLPYAKFSADANSILFTLDNLTALAKKYNASLECVFIRFCEVVQKPCAIMFAHLNEKGKLSVEYMIQSQSSKLKEVTDDWCVPISSKAYECIKPGWTSHAIEKWEIFGGQAQHIYSIGLPAIRKQKTSRVGMFLFPENGNSVEKRKIYKVAGDATMPRGNGNKIIAQVVNTSAGVGFGFGRAMAQKYPASRKALEAWKGNKKDFILGESQLIKLTDDVYVFQMVAQQGIFPKYGEVPLKYPSLHRCLIDLAEAARHHNASVHMPLIGAGQAKGNWEIIEGMIYQELILKDIDVTVYLLPGKPLKSEENKLELF